MKFVRVVLSPEAEEVFRYLNERAPKSKQERMILGAILKKISLKSTMSIMASRSPKG